CLASGSAGEAQRSFLETSERTHSFQVVCRDVLHEDGLVRHDPDKLARLLLEIHQTATFAMG
ncbi:MAG: hypothetical protein WAV47_16285, partial [Blastocatellia bacterium]